MFKEANDAIEAHLSNNWGDTPIDFDNVNYRPVRGTAFVRLQIEWANSVAISIGGLSRGSGYIDLSIFVPVNTGVAIVNGLADDLAALYNKWQTGGLRFLVGRTQRVGQQEEWYQLKVLVPFTYDECITP